MPFAERIRHKCNIATVTVGIIWSADLAALVVREVWADLVAIARELLANPNLSLKAAGTLGIESNLFENWKLATD